MQILKNATQECQKKIKKNIMINVELCNIRHKYFRTKNITPFLCRLCRCGLLSLERDILVLQLVRMRELDLVDLD